MSCSIENWWGRYTYDQLVGRVSCTGGRGTLCPHSSCPRIGRATLLLVGIGLFRISLGILMRLAFSVLLLDVAWLMLSALSFAHGGSRFFGIDSEWAAQRTGALADANMQLGCIFAL